MPVTPHTHVNDLPWSLNRYTQHQTKMRVYEVNVCKARVITDKISRLPFSSPEGTSGAILKSQCLSVRPSVRSYVTNRVSSVTQKLTQ